MSDSAAARLRCFCRPRAGFAPRERRMGAGGQAPGAQPRGQGGQEGGGASAGRVTRERRESRCPNGPETEPHARPLSTPAALSAAE